MDEDEALGRSVGVVMVNVRNVKRVVVGGRAAQGKGCG